MVGRFERFSYAITEISRHLHKISADELEKYGLKGSYAVYFTTLQRYPEGITSAQLGTICGRDKSDVSRAVSAMVQKGLITRESVGENHYRARLILTEEGHLAAQIISQKAQLAVELGGKGLSPEQRESFYASIELIASNLQTLSEEGLP